MSGVLPGLLVLTDRTQAAAPLPEVVAAAVDAGARAVVLREKDLPPPERAALADALAAVLAPVGGLLVVAGPPGPAGRTAVHLAAADPFPRPRPALVGRSCHSADEVDRAAAEGCDWVLVSPVFPTPSKPGYGPALGPAGLARLVRGAPPVHALGGVTPGDVADCLRAGAAGVAVMGPVMRDPGRVSEYLAALGEPTR
ncbi:thiamine phosphate synthase [Trujillonella endophytica]|uniref:Thiamine-phosphate pyrophosphorylase n=1 Tax=Trujillonella endophytica TaxID=673521 RepID=A0A1H8VDB9_9ACTN|nr:thiamine phosphate synthase [Trujillella endophytica]SEP13470.1 thiamine-phosphate pyrophosphorylase [Trujillella endophytica]